MKQKEHLINYLRGWIPKEATLPSRATTNQTKPNHSREVFQNIIFGIVVAVGLFSSIFFLSSSWIKFLTIGIFLVFGIAWFISHGRSKKALKLLIVTTMILAITLTSFEVYAFSNAGYPATVNYSDPKTTFSLQKIQNLSLAKIIQDLEQTPAFSLLKLEHGNSNFESMKLSGSLGFPGGYIAVDFASENSNAYFHFFSDNGHQYVLEQSTYIGQLMSQQHPSKQTVDQALNQIDALGINWFFNQALKLAQNRTTNLPTVDSLDISLFFGEGLGSYQGITLELIGYHQTVLPNGSINGDGILISDFQPDGTLIVMTRPPQA